MRHPGRDTRGTHALSILPPRVISVIDHFLSKCAIHHSFLSCTTLRGYIYFVFTIEVIHGRPVSGVFLLASAVDVVILISEHFEGRGRSWKEERS